MSLRRVLTAASLAACSLVAGSGAALAQAESDLAKATQNPVANLTSLPLQFNYYTGGGLQSKTALVLNLQPVMPLSLDKQWLLIARTIVPYANVPLASGDRATGIADIQEQWYFTPKQPGAVVWGVGPLLSIPTATNDVMRTGQWALGPTAVGLVTTGRWVVGVLANNIWRIAGVNNGRPINELTLQPFINFNIPQGWAIATAPIITADWSAPSGEKWTVPLGVGLQKITAIGHQPVSLGMQYYHRVEHPANAGAEEFRFIFSLLYPIAHR